MADTVSTPTPFVSPPSKAAREAFDERPRPDDTRVSAVQEADRSARARETAEVEDAEIERLAAETLKNSRLSIKREEESGQFVYLMVDDETGEAVRRWPPEKHSDLVAYLRSPQAGFIDKLA
jgi:uncharacterized FlaG/YvyC family protein